MKSFALFVIAFLIVATILLSAELRNLPDYQAYTRPTVEDRLK